MDTVTFDPVVYSLAECHFLLDHLGESPAVAFDTAPPEGVNPTQVTPLLQYVRDLEELKEQKNRDWAGVEALKECLTNYLEAQAQWRDLQRQGGPRFPTLYSFDAKGRPHYGGIGSDSQRVRTRFTSEGKRVKLAIPFVGSERADWHAPWSSQGAEAPKELIENTTKNTIECAVCHHQESYRGDSKSSYNAARARISGHMKKAEIEPELHREYRQNVFGS